MQEDSEVAVSDGEAAPELPEAGVEGTMHDLCNFSPIIWASITSSQSAVQCKLATKTCTWSDCQQYIYIWQLPKQMTAVPLMSCRISWILV